MFRKTWLLILALAFGLVIGLMLNRTSLQLAFAQETENAERPDKVFVQGHSRAISSLSPPGEQFTLIPSNAPTTSFKIVPPGKKFVLTDVVYHPQYSVRQVLTVNIANYNPINNAPDILFQVRLEPNKSDQVHLCSGYVIASGHGLAAFTNAGLQPEQYVSISITGYLADE
jgi:hypothetical protein